MAKRKAKTAIRLVYWEDKIYNVRHQCTVCTREEIIDYARTNLDCELGADYTGDGFTLAREDPKHGLAIHYWFDSRAVANVGPTGRIIMIAHEASHGTDVVMKSRGIKLCKQTSEPRAYYLGAVSGALLEMINTLTRKPKPRRKG
jgi:hypothetical protein